VVCQGIFVPAEELVKAGTGEPEDGEAEHTEYGGLRLKQAKRLKELEKGERETQAAGGGTVAREADP
jgi:hypothetical protein